MLFSKKPFVGLPIAVVVVALTSGCEKDPVTDGKPSGSHPANLEKAPV